ncbi:MAG: hypothetical protein Q8R63_08035 [Ramlibacter sp.]|nr:hypothetical protein [Ramlibacter sp.]
MNAFHTTAAAPGVSDALDEAAMAEYMERCQELMKLGQYAGAQAISRRLLECGSLQGNDREDFEDVFAESSLQSSLEGAVHAENFVRQLLARSSEPWRTQTLEAALARALLRQGRAQEAIEAQSAASAVRIPGPRIMALHSSCRFEEAETQFNYWILGRQAPGRREFIGQTGRTAQGNGPQRLDWEVPVMERLCSRMETGAWLNKDRVFFNSAASMIETGMNSDLACFSYFVKPVHQNALWPMLLRCQGLDQPLPPPLVNPACARVQ